MAGPTGPQGFNGSQGPTGRNGSIGPPGPKGSGDFSACQYKRKADSLVSGSSTTVIGFAEPSVSMISGSMKKIDNWFPLYGGDINLV